MVYTEVPVIQSDNAANRQIIFLPQIFCLVVGAIFAPTFAKLFRITDPVAEGVAIGACSHAMGTAKALELGETEGAMSGLAIGLCGILTTVLALLADFFVI